MQLAHNMWQKSQAAAAGAASSLQSVMSPLLALHLQPVDQAVPVERTVQSLQQMRQMRNETVADVAASLARSFRQGMIQHEMHTEEVSMNDAEIWAQGMTGARAMMFHSLAVPLGVICKQ